MEGSPTAAVPAREARRRRIVDRGSDRLALITGRIKTLPSESEAPKPGSDNPRGHLHTSSCPPSITQTQLLPEVDTNSDSQDLPQDEDKILPEIDKKSTYKSLVGPQMRRCGSSSEPSRASILDHDTREHASQVVTSIQTPQVSKLDASHHSESLFSQTRHITYKQVSAAFTATQTSRLHCSLGIAILVLLSYIGFPLPGSRFLRSVILFRPLYLLLLTNITIAVAQLLENSKGLLKPEQRRTSVPSLGSKDWTDQVGSALDLGLMLQNVTGALIMDSSIYVIIVICGLSLVQALGW